MRHDRGTRTKYPRPRIDKPQTDREAIAESSEVISDPEDDFTKPVSDNG